LAGRGRSEGDGRRRIRRGRRGCTVWRVAGEHGGPCWHGGAVAALGARPANQSGVASWGRGWRGGAAGWGWGEARRRGGLGLGRGSVRGTEKKTTRRRAEAEMNEEEVFLVLKLPNFRRPSSRPPKITHYFWWPCQRPPKIRQFSAAVSVAAKNWLIFGGS
jgi:hypothetical protein